MPMQKLFNTSGLLYYAWYIPYGVILLILIIVYAKFLFKLPKKVKSLFMLSGLIFVFGAIGLESISGFYDELIGQQNFEYCALYTIEELFEMCGVAIFIYALLLYISDEVEHLDIKIVS
jgi:predicted permease